MARRWRLAHKSCAPELVLSVRLGIMTGLLKMVLGRLELGLWLRAALPCGRLGLASGFLEMVLGLLETRLWLGCGILGSRRAQCYARGQSVVGRRPAAASARSEYRPRAGCVDRVAARDRRGVPAVVVKLSAVAGAAGGARARSIAGATVARRAASLVAGAPEARLSALMSDRAAHRTDGRWLAGRRIGDSFALTSGHEQAHVASLTASPTENYRSDGTLRGFFAEYWRAVARDRADGVVTTPSRMPHRTALPTRTGRPSTEIPTRSSASRR